MITLSEDHIYSVNGQKMAGVTSIIKSTIGVGWEAEQWYLDRGTAVHACAKLIADGKKFEYDPQIEGYVQAIYKFFREVKPEIIASEKMVYSNIYKFAGMLDLVCIIENKKVIVDYKSSIDIERLKLQLGGYSIGYEEIEKDKILSGLGVELNKNSRYKMTEMLDLKISRNEFLALRTVERIKQRLGV